MATEGKPLCNVWLVEILDLNWLLENVVEHLCYAIPNFTMFEFFPHHSDMDVIFSTSSQWIVEALTIWFSDNEIKLAKENKTLIGRYLLKSKLIKQQN